MFGVAGFFAALATIFLLELSFFASWEWVWGESMRPVGFGWLVAPIAAGIGAWRWCTETGLRASIRGSLKFFERFRNPSG
jgi:hypothetical protein